MTDQNTTRNASLQPSRQYQHAVRKLQREGVRPTARASVEYLRPRPLRDVVVPYALESYPEKVVSRDDLIASATAEDRLWYLDATDGGGNDGVDLTGRVPKSLLAADSRRETRSPPPVETVQPFIDDTPFVCEVPDGRVVGSEPIGLTADGEILLDTFTHTTERNTRLADATHAVLRERGFEFALETLFGGKAQRAAENVDAEFGTVSMLTNPWTNYYHWTVEHLPKIRALERYEEATGRTPTLLVPADPTDWMRELLELVGVDLENCVQWTYGRARAERLVVPSYPCATPATTRWVKERVLGSVPESTRSQPRPNRIVISRREADQRRVRNESEMMEALEEFEFRSYVLEDLPVAEQAALFADADVVVAPHGAGLTNMIYADDLTVVELFGNVRSTYYRMATMCGFEYRYHLCESRDGDLRVDVDDLRATLSNVL